MKKYGLYSYTHACYDSRGVRSYVPHTVRVEVVNETAKQYRVKYLGFHASGAAVGSLHHVRKDKVRLDSPTPVAATAAREIRLPYKDND